MVNGSTGSEKAGQGTGWRTGKPSSGTRAYVWYMAEEVLATWTGRHWVDGDRKVLLGAHYWRLSHL